MGLYWGRFPKWRSLIGQPITTCSQVHQFENLGKSLLIKGGGRAWVIPCVQRADFLPMNIFQILVTSPDVPTINGVKISVQGVAQVKIGSDDQFLRYASFRSRYFWYFWGLLWSLQRSSSKFSWQGGFRNSVNSASYTRRSSKIYHGKDDCWRDTPE